MLSKSASQFRVTRVASHSEYLKRHEIFLGLYSGHQEWGMKFSEQKREAARNNTKLKRLATVEVKYFRAIRRFDVIHVFSGCCATSSHTHSQRVYDRAKHLHRFWHVNLKTAGRALPEAAMRRRDRISWWRTVSEARVGDEPCGSCGITMFVGSANMPLPKVRDPTYLIRSR